MAGASEVVLETTMVGSSVSIDYLLHITDSGSLQGTITVELYTEHAPRTCANYSTLASRGYYNNQIFHRVIPNFMIQTGDPTGTGRGGSSIYGEKFADEISPSLKHVGAGVLSMANSGPNTNGSQYFITTAPTPVSRRACYRMSGKS